MQSRIERNRYREKAFNNQIEVSAKFELDTHLVAALKNVKHEFYDVFQKGLNNYISGNWGHAKDYLKKAEKMRNPDNPSKLLLSYMDEFKFQAPTNWKGFRPLTTK